jgi:hypothetical protein
VDQTKSKLVVPPVEKASLSVESSHRISETETHNRKVFRADTYKSRTMEMEDLDVAPFLLSHNTFLLIKAIGLVLSSLGAYLIAQYVYLLVFHPLADIPGPRLCSVSRIPYWFAVLQGRDVKWLYQLHLNYGSVVRFGPTDISYSTAEAWKDVHGYNKGSPESIKAPEFSVQPANGTSSPILGLHES